MSRSQLLNHISIYQNGRIGDPNSRDLLNGIPSFNCDLPVFTTNSHRETHHKQYLSTETEKSPQKHDHCVLMALKKNSEHGTEISYISRVNRR